MYDTFSDDYDRFVNWANRLAFELPFLERLLAPLGHPARILDAACGTGMHAIALAQRGHLCAGADLSAAMITRAQANAAAAGVNLPFASAGFGALAATFDGSQRMPFDAVLCLGNSLPHVLSPADLVAALADFAACLRAGGVLIVQSRNFDTVMAHRERFMEPQAYQQGGEERIFVRFYDYDPDGLITFNIRNLARSANSAWTQHLLQTRLMPQPRTLLESAAQTAGFRQIQAFGGMDGSPFDPEKSGNLVLVATK
jgi:glycine/sarcosine N-methyltransferase